MTPLDIKKRSFTTAWRGYDPGQVQTFLESVAREFEEQYKQNAQLQEKLKASEERVYQYRLIEKTLQDAAITLQQSVQPPQPPGRIVGSGGTVAAGAAPDRVSSGIAHPRTVAPRPRR